MAPSGGAVLTPKIPLIPECLFRPKSRPGVIFQPPTPLPSAAGSHPHGGSSTGAGPPSIQIFAATPLHFPGLRLCGSHGFPLDASPHHPPCPGIRRYTATRAGRAEWRRPRSLMPDPGLPLAHARLKHGRRAEHAVWKPSSCQKRQGRLVPYVVTQQPAASRCADARPEKSNDIKEIGGSGERT